MKTFFFLLLSITYTTFAQNNYHKEVKKSCSQEACIKTQFNEYELVKNIDQDGGTYESINSNSSILDINFNKSCFTGPDHEVSKIIEALAGNTDADYYNGGHAYIKNIKISTSIKSIHADIEYGSDYSQETQKISILILKC